MFCVLLFGPPPTIRALVLWLDLHDPQQSSSWTGLPYNRRSTFIIAPLCDFGSGLKLTKKPDVFIEIGFANRTKVSKYANPMGMGLQVSEDGAEQARSSALWTKKGNRAEIFGRARTF